MHHHINHCFCHNSNHDGEDFYARNMVSMKSYEPDHKEDWNRLIITEDVVCPDRLETQRRIAENHPEIFGSEEDMMQFAKKPVPTFRPEVLDWLDQNIKPCKDGPGWAMGNQEYRSYDNQEITLWFTRKSDAKKFIKQWSSFGIATSYFDYFADPIVNLVLDVDTMQYRNRHEDNR